MYGTHGALAHAGGADSGRCFMAPHLAEDDQLGRTKGFWKLIDEGAKTGRASS